ncbi:hypothetical protein Poly51_06860 [Rubripirellula tenax]|uniref:DUF5666 domain-containing protein n=1 Tax=Rubripirellula tenax TaxID=2528015 RepID=A0A5C6FHQ6_9BACT|nr:hypothetical protein [Rubripirellula tenax]TWU60410.1 hypothetical protein Poly51_06860 [Rubripirellula tenax]
MSRFFHRFVVAAVAAMVIANLSSSGAVAQDGVADVGSNMVTEFKGKLKSFQRGVVIVVRDDDTEVMVQPPDSPDALVFVAEAKPAFLQRGMMVRFRGEFTQAGEATKPITKIELFQPVNGNLSGHARESFIPGIYGDRRGRNEPAPPVAEVNVVGGLLGMDGTGIMVQAGKVPVRAPVAPDAKLEVRFNNLSLAQEGDIVSVSGFYQPPDETKVKAERIVITTDRVYGEPTDIKPVRKTRRTTTRRTDAEAAADNADVTEAAAE